MKLRISLVLLLSMMTFAFPAICDDIKVAAASDLQFALRELGNSFQQQTGHKLVVSFGSSGNLYSQIRSGAPYDLFFSADMDLPRQLVQNGLAEPDTFYRYGRGWLVLWAPKSSNIDPRALKMNALLAPGVEKIAIANPQHAPYGRAAEAALRSAKLYDQLRPKLVFGENISQAAQFVQSGNAQLGILAQSLVLAPAMHDKGSWWELPSDIYPPIDQAVVLLKSAEHVQAARAFLAFLKTPAARHTLDIYGFRSTPGGTFASGK
jgi:molybdate transport system substrate-binding protein